MPIKTINILGVTGSIGQSAADVILAQPERFDVRVISANTNRQKLEEMAKSLGAHKAVLASEDSIEDALDEPVDITLAAIVGMAGLKPIIKAIQNSKAVAIANKEPLVSAGHLVIAEARKHGCKLLPVDSEHNAIFQVFDFERPETIEKIILTASGGPFLNWTADQIAKATPEQAVAHPNWDMGAKISVDSATMMNKVLEIIEAHYLFDMPPSKIEVLIHPQSIVHSMVEYKDGSVLAQMGASDMRTPISNVLAWPDRLETPGARLDLARMSALSFEAPDLQKFPALKLAYECMAAGGYACVALNAANEVAVDAFLSNKILFPDIINTIRFILDETGGEDLSTIEEIILFDQTVRTKTKDYINKNKTSERKTA